MDKKEADNTFHDCFDTQVWQRLRAQCSGVSRVHLSEVEISKQAMITIGLATQEIGRHLCLEDARQISQRMWKSCFQVGGDLMFVFTVPELDAEMQVVIPAGQWRLKDAVAGFH
jgi:hypothetical protein